MALGFLTVFGTQVSTLGAATFTVFSVRTSSTILHWRRSEWNGKRPWRGTVSHPSTYSAMECCRCDSNGSAIQLASAGALTTIVTPPKTSDT